MGIQVLEPGAVLKLLDCENILVEDNEQAIESKLEAQSFVVDAQSGESRLRADDELCVTAGWPFLNAVAFSNPQGKTVVVVTNEASVATPIVLTDKAVSGRLGPLSFIIDGRSMETLVY